jgi:hypothetical protein
MKAAIPILLLITTVLACDDKGGADDSEADIGGTGGFSAGTDAFARSRKS